MNTTSGQHPTEAIEPSVESAEGRAKIAIIAIGLYSMMELGLRATELWLGPKILMQRQVAVVAYDATSIAASMVLALGALASLIASIASAVFFLYWLRGVGKTARLLGATPRFSVSDATWAFFIPVLNITRPYLVMKDLNDALLDDRTQAVANGAPDAGAYREPAAAVERPTPRLPESWLKLWWLSYLAGGFFAPFLWFTKPVAVVRAVGAVEVCSKTFALASAVLVAMIIQRMTARLRERFERVRRVA